MAEYHVKQDENLVLSDDALSALAEFAFEAGLEINDEEDVRKQVEEKMMNIGGKLSESEFIFLVDGERVEVRLEGVEKEFGQTLSSEKKDRLIRFNPSY